MLDSEFEKLGYPRNSLCSGPGSFPGQSPQSPWILKIMVKTRILLHQPFVLIVEWEDAAWVKEEGIERDSFVVNYLQAVTKPCCCLQNSLRRIGDLQLLWTFSPLYGMNLSTFAILSANMCYSVTTSCLLIAIKCLCAVLCLVAQSCPTLCNPVDCSLPGFSVHGILQARILVRVTMPSSRGSF